MQWSKKPEETAAALNSCCMQRPQHSWTLILFSCGAPKPIKANRSDETERKTTRLIIEFLKLVFDPVPGPPNPTQSLQLYNQNLGLLNIDFPHHQIMLYHACMEEHKRLRHDLGLPIIEMWRQLQLASSPPTLVSCYGLLWFVHLQKGNTSNILGQVLTERFNFQALHDFGPKRTEIF